MQRELTHYAERLVSLCEAFLKDLSQREHKWGIEEGQREREKQAPAKQGAQRGARSHDPRIII